MNTIKKLTISLTYLFLIVCPLNALAECPSRGTATEIISKVHIFTYKWKVGADPTPLKTIHDYCGFGNGPTGSLEFTDVTSVINKLPQCQPIGDLHRECVDHKVESTFPIADGCVVKYEYTACAYSPFKNGILNQKSLGIQKRPRARSPRRGRQR